MPPLLLSLGKKSKQDHPQAAGHMFLGESFTSWVWISVAALTNRPSLRNPHLTMLFCLDPCMEIILCENCSEGIQGMKNILNGSRSNYLYCCIVPLSEDHPSSEEKELLSHHNPLSSFTFLAHPDILTSYIYTLTNTHICIMPRINGDIPRANLSYTGNWTKCPGAKAAAASSCCRGEVQERKK